MVKKFNISEEELFELYINQQLSTTEIAEIKGCSKPTIRSHLKKYGIPARSVSEAKVIMNGLNISKEDLIELYVNQQLSIREIAEIKGCSKGTINNYLKKYGIPIRSVSEAMVIKNGFNISKEDLIELYVNQQLSTNEIAEMKGYSSGTIRRYLKKYGIPVRSVSEAMVFKNNGLNISEKDLIELYVNQQLSMIKIAEIKGCTRTTIRSYLKKYGIPVRSLSEARVIKNIYHIDNYSTWCDESKFKEFLIDFKEEYGRKPQRKDLEDTFNSNAAGTLNKIHKYDLDDFVDLYPNTSNFQIKVQDWLKNNNYKFEREFSIGNKRYDIKVGNTLIECNPNDTHCIRPNEDLKYQTCKLNIDYHMEKTKLATDNGFNCINMFQWNLEDIDNVLKFLDPDYKIYQPNRPSIVIDLDIENPDWYPDYEPDGWYEHKKYVKFNTDEWSNEYIEGFKLIYGAGYLKMRLKN